MSLKNPVTPPGIDSGTIRLIAPCLNHYATRGPVLVLVKIIVAVMKTVMNTIDETYVILLLQFWKLLIGGGIVQDVW
jgi:hypothetical protein